MGAIETAKVANPAEAATTKAKRRCLGLGFARSCRSPQPGRRSERACSKTAEVTQSAAHEGRVVALEGKVDAIESTELANRSDDGGRGTALGGKLGATETAGVANAADNNSKKAAR